MLPCGLDVKIFATLEKNSSVANYADGVTAAAGEVLPIFADRVCCVVSTTDPSLLQTEAATFSFK
jgi:hypothetical protein